jgi:DNA polymerase III delta prime subunit
MLAAMAATRHDWGEAPDVPVMEGRTQELVTLTRWACEERCRLVLVLGEGGVGKTTLAARLAHDLLSEFAAVHWRSLRHAPQVEDWLAGAIAALSASHALLPQGVEARLGLLLELLRAHRVLLVLDNLETVLEPGVPGVRYRAGYEGYCEVLRRLGEIPHQSCLLVTSREQPLREDHVAVRVLGLQGIGVDDARALLGQHDLAGDPATWGALVARYAGNPLALCVVGKTIGAVFGGSIAGFLAQDVAVFGTGAAGAEMAGGGAGAGGVHRACDRPRPAPGACRGGGGSGGASAALAARSGGTRRL